jgi:hypothetical protein
VLQSFVDSEPSVVTQQVWEIGDTVRLAASHGVDLSQQQGARRSRAKLLFHHQPYAAQVGGGAAAGVVWLHVVKPGMTALAVQCTWARRICCRPAQARLHATHQSSQQQPACSLSAKAQLR